MLRAEPEDNPPFRAWLAELKPAATAAGVPEATFDRIFAAVGPDCGLTGVFCAAPANDTAQPSWSERTGLRNACDKIPQREFLEPAVYFPEAYINRLVRKGQALLADLRLNRKDAYQHIVQIEQNAGVRCPF